MTCFHPLDAVHDGAGKPIIYSKAHPPPVNLADGFEHLQLACGQCIGCRVDRSLEWAVRIVHESQMHQDNCFITLTYDEEHLPPDGSLNKAHFQKFMKRLRRRNEHKEIRFFHCGEYGEKLSRPHYHACLFGLDFSDRVPFGISNDVVTYVSDELTSIWGMGFTTVGNLNYETAAYTARYIMKKITGDKATEHYQHVNPLTGEIHELQPEYITMSLGREKGQGIGGSFFKKYQSDFFPRDECPVPGRGVYKSVPKYYDELYKLEHPDAYAKIKQARRSFHESQGSDFTPARLEQREKVKLAQLAQLPRRLEQ